MKQLFLGGRRKGHPEGAPKPLPDRIVWSLQVSNKGQLMGNLSHCRSFMVWVSVEVVAFAS